jgi:hypothetical protein
MNQFGIDSNAIMNEREFWRTSKIHAVDIIFARAQDVLSILNQNRNKAVVTSRFSKDDLASNETRIACIKSSRIRMQVFPAQQLRLTAACIDCLRNNCTFLKAKTRT